MFLTDDVKITSCLDYASGTAARNGATLDMQGYDGAVVLVITGTHAAGAVGGVKWQQDTDSAMGTAADLAGTNIALDADDDDLIVVNDLYRPRERYVRACVVKDGSNAQAESALYIQYRGKAGPVTNEDSGEVTQEQHNAPAEGTA